MERDYSKLPFITLSKENLQLLYDSVEEEQIGKIMIAVFERIYLGVTPTFDTKVETGAYNQLMAVIERKAEGYFKQVEAGKEYGVKGGRPKKSKGQSKPIEEPQAPEKKAIDNQGATTYEAPQPIVEKKPSKELQEVIDSYPQEVELISRDYNMYKDGYEEYGEQVNRRMADLKYNGGIEDRIMWKLYNYINYQYEMNHQSF